MPENKAAAHSHKTHILIKGARTHNLQDVTVAIPRGKLVVITGLSGSGKSSLAFDTLYAEGQRRYVESLSSYARQFLDKMDKPEVASIEGISPAIAIEQKTVSGNARSTVGTITEVYDYLKLLFARVGRTYSPISGLEVKRHSTTDVVDYLAAQPEGARMVVLAPLVLRSGRSVADQLEALTLQGYSRILLHGEQQRIADVDGAEIHNPEAVQVVIDRLVQQTGDAALRSRLADSVETAFFEGNGHCLVQVTVETESVEQAFSNQFEADGMRFELPTVHFFSFNNPLGACKTCEGYGSVIGIDRDSVIPNKRLSIYEDAIQAWRGDKMEAWKLELLRNAEKFDFPVHRPYNQLTREQQDLLWSGNAYFRGLDAFFEYLESKAYKIQYRVMLSRYRGKTVCPKCRGSRIRPDAQYVKIDGHSIVDFLEMPVGRLREVMRNLSLSESDQQVAQRLLSEVSNRLEYLTDVGLAYLALSRPANTLSGGESQRIKLATSLGSSLVGSMYILDEPSIGLHPNDTHKLIQVLRSLQSQGNTVIVVEHDEEIMRAADTILDMGPGAGSLGGKVVFQGDMEALLRCSDSLTGRYLREQDAIEVPASRRAWKHQLLLRGARANNLRDLDVGFPLGCLVAVSGVSGSGKSTLVTELLYPALQKQLGQYGERLGEMDELAGDLKRVAAVSYVDQNPIGKSSRSNPVTYVKAFDEIRALYAAQKLAKLRNYKASHFSFNVKGGRCETCEGEGSVTIEMQFMADIRLTCETCKGKRYKAETLEVTYRHKDISQLLEMTVAEAVDFFGADPANKLAQRAADKLEPLLKVGMGYVQLGQASSTLSGGEAQRTKLAAFLAKGDNEPPTLFIFDEPTTGLHFHDVAKLLTSFTELIDRGHSVLVIEHNLDVIKCADWVIDLGPEGGQQGGSLVYAGTPEGLAEYGTSLTGKYLKQKLALSSQAG